MTYDAEYRDATTAVTTTPGTSVAVNIPAGAHIGDALVAVILTNGGTPTITPISTYGTWTDRKLQANTSNGASATVFTKPCSAGDLANLAQTWTTSPGSRSAAIVAAYADVDLTTPMDIAPVSANGSSTAPASASMTPSAGQTGDVSVFIAAASVAAASTPPAITWTHPTGYTNDINVRTLGTSGTGNCYGFLTDKKVGGSATGTLTGAMDASHSWATIGLLLRQKSTDTAPIVDAGIDQSVTGNDIVNLAMTASDPDGDTLTKTWIQTAGTVAGLTDNGDGTADFTAPNVGDTLTFQATAFDGTNSTSDTMQVTITPQSTFSVGLRASSDSDGTSPGTTFAIVVPATVQFGDNVLIHTLVNGVQSCTEASGTWTLLLSLANSSNGVTYRLYQKTMNPQDDAGSSVTFTLGSSGRMWLLCEAYKDVDETTPEDVAVVSSTGTSTAPTAPTATPANDDDMSILAYATSLAAPATSLAWTTPSGYGDTQVGNTSGASGGGNVYLAVYDKALGPGTGGTPTGTTATSINQSRQWVAVRILLRQKTVNSPPIPDAGADQSDIEPYVMFTLAGTANDPDGNPVTLSWANDPGNTPHVTLDDNGQGVATGIAPPTLAGGPLVFVLTADDGNGGIATDSCTVTINPHNQWAAVGGMLVPERHQVAITG